ncbi:MAG: DUF3108 domain-containing protein [Ignavibacteriales bacterium]|nr:DUF3108 domain-containing protein [Ignavibacteriales bacterium]
MKTIHNIIILILFPFTITFTQVQESGQVKSVDSLRDLNQIAFTRGERLVYDVGYSFITAAEAVFSIPEIQTISERECYQVLFTVNTTKTFSFFYKVDDRYETMIDKKGIFPWRYSQRIREGKYSNDFAAEFDQLHNVATTKEGRYPIPPYVHDVVSAMFYYRTMDFSKSRPGQKEYLQNFTKDKTYQLAVKFIGYQQISVDAGTFDCVVVEPLIMEGGLFKSEGRIIIWMTNDERKIPVKVSTKVPIGSIDAELREYSGINGPIKAKVK